ncbi:MAG TPA: ABC transporter permease [Caulobacteraceae bacterium]|jgi:spermidine/putrescine transport system permease protein
MDESWARAKGVFTVVSGPPVVWLTAFFLVPLSIIWAFSFGDNVSLTRIAVDGTFANYAHALKPLYLGIIWKSLWFAAATTALCLIAGFPIAVAITFASERAKVWLLLLIMLPFWTNLLIRTYALMAVLRDEGYINAGLSFSWHGASHLTALFGHPLGAFHPLPLLHNNFAVIFGLVYVQLPFMVLPLYAALDRLDRSLLEASLDLGAGHLTTFARVVVPLAIPGIVSGVLVTFIPSIGAYLTPDLLGGPSSQMIANVIENQFKTANDWPFGAALSFLLMYMTFVAMAAQGMAARARRESRP